MWQRDRTGHCPAIRKSRRPFVGDASGRARPVPGRRCSVAPPEEVAECGATAWLSADNASIRKRVHRRGRAAKSLPVATARRGGTLRRSPAPAARHRPLPASRRRLASAAVSARADRWSVVVLGAPARAWLRPCSRACPARRGAQRLMPGLEHQHWPQYVAQVFTTAEVRAPGAADRHWIEMAFATQALL